MQVFERMKHKPLYSASESKDYGRSYLATTVQLALESKTLLDFCKAVLKIAVMRLFVLFTSSLSRQIAEISSKELVLNLTYCTGSLAPKIEKLVQLVSIVVRTWWLALCKMRDFPERNLTGNFIGTFSKYEDTACFYKFPQKHAGNMLHHIITQCGTRYWSTPVNTHLLR